MYDKNHYSIVISLQLIKINGKKRKLKKKPLIKVNKDRILINIIKVIYDKPTLTSYSTVKIWKPFLLNQEQDKDALLSFLFNTLLEAPVTAIRQEKEKVPKFFPKEKSVTIHRWFDALYRKPWNLHPKTIRLIN